MNVSNIESQISFFLSRRRADDILLQNLIADDDHHSGSGEIDHIEFSAPDVDDLDQDLELPNVVFDGPQDDH